jgi:hypothetical protein
MKFNKPLDFTSATFYTLSPTSETILQNLDKPVKVIVLLDGNVRQHAFLLSLVKPMLANCQAITDKLEVEYLADDPNKGTLRVDELRKKYPDVGAGLLVIYDAGGGDGKGAYKLVGPGELVGDDPMRGQAAFDFRGENALMTQIDFLVHGQKKVIVYATQGNGELDIKDSQIEDPAARERGLRRPNYRGCGLLKERLEKRNVEVRPLEFSVTKPEVPADAEVVAILGPKKTFSAPVIKALDDYMGRKGKLLVLLGPEAGPAGNAQPTGLEEMLNRYGAQLPSEVVYGAKSPSGDPRMILAEPNPKFENNPLVSRFLGTKPLVFIGARPVRPAGSPGMSLFVPEAVLVADSDYLPWVENNLSLDYLEKTLRDMSRNQQLLERKLQPGRQNPIPLGLAISESSMPPNPHMGMMAPPPRGDQTPRLVVIGSASMASNAIISAQFVDSSNADYLASSIDWLKGRTNSIGISPKKSSIYALPASLQQSANYWSFVLLPALLILLGVVGAGTGVWLVRRR